MTFATVPKIPSNDLEKSKLMISFYSWLSSYRHSVILVFGNESDFNFSAEMLRFFDDSFREDSNNDHVIRFEKQIQTNKYGIPFINDWFIQGFQLSSTDFITFINSDIILPADWGFKIPLIYKRLGESAIIINGRINCDFDSNKIIQLSQKFTTNRAKYFDFSKELNYLLEGAPAYKDICDAVDIFTLSKNSGFDPKIIPPFLMGFVRWDNWLAGYFNIHYDTVSMSFSPPLYHFNHLSNSTNRNRSFSRYNKRLFKRRGSLIGTNCNPKWYVRNYLLLKMDSQASISLL